MEKKKFVLINGIVEGDVRRVGEKEKVYWDKVMGGNCCSFGEDGLEARHQII